MPSKVKRDEFEGWAPEYRAYFSIEYYEAELERYSSTILRHGRPLIGLQTAPAHAAPREPTSDELDAADAFVCGRLFRTGLGFLALSLNEQEWGVVADHQQAPWRVRRPAEEARADIPWLASTISFSDDN
jgi:hypothetical protein